MSKMFILDRSGVNPSMVETPKNSIPVYADKASAEADLTNLSVGQIVATESTHEDDVADLKTYIKNQNVLSDWETVTLATVQSGTPQSPTEMEYDGVLSVSLYSVTLAPSNIYVNGTAIPAAGVNGSGVTTATEIPVNKGDLVYVDNIYGQNTVRSSYVRYYKLRDYTGR